jgi:hypothetical protein
VGGSASTIGSARKKTAIAAIAVLLLINVAHGEILMVGAYVGFYIATFLLGIVSHGATPLTTVSFVARPDFADFNNGNVRRSKWLSSFPMVTRC